MNKQLLFFIIPLLIGISSSLFTLKEGEQAIILKFGEPISDKPIENSGLHFKVPIMNTVHKFEKRILEWDGKPEEIPTKDNKYIYIDSFARWVISDPLNSFELYSTKLL